MATVNYIHQHIAFFTRVYEDERLNPSHICIYMALFQYWNLSRFSPTFSVARSEVMKLSKVKSKSTYSKCLNELQKWEYIVYNPSHNPFKGSEFNLTNKWTTTEPVHDVSSPFNEQPQRSSRPNNGPPLVPYKTDKHKRVNNKEKPHSESQVIEFFQKTKSNKSEGQKFWNHYQSNGWLIGKANMVDWQAAARKWILNQNHKTKNGLVQQMDYLQTTTKKDYNEPL